MWSKLIHSTVYENKEIIFYLNFTEAEREMYDKYMLFFTFHCTQPMYSNLNYQDYIIKTEYLVIYDSHFLSGFSQGAECTLFSRTKCVLEPSEINQPVSS